MISLGSIKRGMAIVHNGEPYVVTDATHSKQGRAQTNLNFTGGNVH